MALQQKINDSCTLRTGDVTPKKRHISGIKFCACSHEHYLSKKMIDLERIISTHIVIC